MYLKILLAGSIIILCLVVSGQAQDPLGYEVPSDLRRTSSLDGDLRYIDPMADPLSIDPLMRPLDTEHSWEYLAKIRGRYYTEPNYWPGIDLRGRWGLNLLDSGPSYLDLTLIQNRDAVFGRGLLSRSGTSEVAFATGQIYGSVLYLDLISEELVLYRCTLSLIEEYLSGTYYAYDTLGRLWTGDIRGGRLG